MSMDNENTALYKETLFDKIFKPQVITLENGHTVRRPRSRTPLIVICLALVLGVPLGVLGVALGTVIAQLCSWLFGIWGISRSSSAGFPRCLTC